MRLLDSQGRPIGHPEPFVFGVDRSLPLLYGPTGDVVVTQPPVAGDGLAAWLPTAMGGGK